ncbi:MAG: hypothetical protein M1155_00315 [Patescibacteria group bacterium]|nr:hypothetical protein [Patescibacteria group bacterium]
MIGKLSLWERAVRRIKYYLFFWREVFSNAFLASAQNPFVLAFYMFKAFLTTSLLKKIIILILLGFGVLIIRDVGRMLNSYITTLRITKR